MFKLSKTRERERERERERLCESHDDGRLVVGRASEMTKARSYIYIYI